jgi:hypothetical protein
MMIRNIAGYPADNEYRHDDQRQYHYQHLPAKLEFFQERINSGIHISSFPGRLLKDCCFTYAYYFTNKGEAALFS